MKSFFARNLLVGRDSVEPSNRSAQRSFALPILFFFATIFPSSAQSVTIGSKKFTESYVLGEIARRALNDSGIVAEHRQGMGGTIILWEALRGAQIDAYPEYTGTIAQQILKTDRRLSLQEIRDSLAKLGIGITEPLGFNNTYALVMRRDESRRLALHTISDLQKHPELKFGLTHEFLDRHDGWQPLRERYQLPQQNVIGIDHALGYAALAKGSIDVKDAYSTDAKIGENNLVVLEDDRQFFPRYDAVFLFRLSLPTLTVAVLHKLEGTLDEARMIRLNAEAERTKNYTRAASLYFDGGLDAASSRARRHLFALIGDRRCSARDSGQSRRRDWSRHSRLRQRCANNSITRPACSSCSIAVFWNQCAHCHRRAFSLWPSANCSQHRLGSTGHRATDP